MTSNDLQQSLDKLANDVQLAIATYLEETGHTNTPKISIEYVVTHTIGAQNFTPTVTVSGELVASSS